MKIRVRYGESGVVSIVITTFVLLIMGLIVVGFGQLVRREQRQTLDRQLSAQALYAAESGLNQAVEYVSNVDPSYTKTTCADDGGPANFTGAVGPAGSNTTYPCLTIDPTTPRLEYGTISTEQSEFVLLKTEGAVSIGQIEISWDVNPVPPAPRPAFPISRPSPSFVPAASWGTGPGVLRTEVMPLPAALTRDSLINSQRVYFLYPIAGAVNSSLAIPYATSPDPSDGQVLDAACNYGSTPKTCRAVINFTAADAKPEVFLRLRSFYTNSQVTVVVRDTGLNEVSVIGAQTVIDVTGKAGDVLKRLQVHVDLTQDPLIPEGVLETLDSVCKRLLVGPGFGFTDQPAPPPPQPDPCAIP